MASLTNNGNTKLQRYGSKNIDMTGDGKMNAVVVDTNGDGIADNFVKFFFGTIYKIIKYYKVLQSIVKRQSLLIQICFFRDKHDECHILYKAFVFKCRVPSFRLSSYHKCL